MTPEAVIAATRHWVETVVVDLNLCPFAKRELVRDRIRFVVSEADDADTLVDDLERELQWLQDNDAVETTLLIHPQALTDFDDYNQFLDVADVLLSQMRLSGELQVASFHPDYQFAGTEADDVENTTNRSPYPMLHLIREASLEAAVMNYPDPENIPARNIETVEALGAEHMRALLQACFARGKAI
ncbi:DUF1415 domain-containing protein [Nitrogeniibacter mangrovi]|uniref:DUF1415 domain-containing protein n=1 Tax=Nitrogeniibacter mangrovi TaxID=2016596 RepID=A0A6C1B0W0_9RHOO|nr:DUF1415 domain-containing protein [Nitrogeniibacter mangrovi]QID17246.1 DUF1415 domain-containing protein [Nitrogeniibacter mangrovi]